MLPFGRFELPSGPQAPAAARRACAHAVRARREHGRPPDSLEQDLRLLVSEVTANAVLHGGAVGGEPVLLAVDVDEARIRVAVTDRGSSFPATRQSRPGGGWGFRLVEEIADRWGVERDHGATTVWFELDRRRR